MEHPIGDMLARNPQCRAVLHEPDVVRIRHFRTTHTLIDPPHHISEEALSVVLQLLSHLILTEVLARRQGNREDLLELRRRATSDLMLSSRYIYVVIMHGVQRGSRG